MAKVDRKTRKISRAKNTPFLLLKRRGEQRSLLIMHRHGLIKSIVL